MEKIDLNEPELGYTFSSCVVAGDFVFTSHQGGIVDDEGRMLGTIEEQTEQSFRNLEKVLKAGGASLKDVVKATVYLKQVEDFGAMREVYRRQFTEGYPARMTATSQFVDPECLVMIEAIALKSVQG